MEHTHVETRDAATVEEMWQTVIPGARISQVDGIHPAFVFHGAAEPGFGFCDYTVGSTMVTESDPGTR